MVAIAVALAVGAAFALAPIPAVSATSVPLASVARALAVGIPVAVGLYAWRSAPFERFGTLLVAGGVIWLVATFSLANASLAYSSGRVAFWIGWAAMPYLVLAFPDGRLNTRTDRIIAGVIGLILLPLYVSTALLVDHYPTPGAWAICGASCPRNAFMVIGHEPWAIAHVIVPLREALTMVVFLVIVARLAARIAAASPVRRRMLAPVLAIAIAEIIVMTFGFALRRAAPGSTALAVALWLVAFALPAMAIAFLVGVLRWRLYVGASLGRFAASLSSPHGPEEVRAAFAEAFEDPTLEIVYPVGDGRWAGADGHPVPRPRRGDGRSVTELCDGSNHPVAALVHDEALQDERAFINAVASYATLSLENQRLAAEVTHLARDMRTTQAHAAASADRTRQQIERDLHDGAQQRLIALQIKLQLAADRSAAQRVGAEELNKLGAEVQLVINELRALARGVFPSVLSDLGPVVALREATRDSPIPTAIVADGFWRYSPEVERALYFCCLEALQNAHKHARDASLVRVEITEHRRTVVFEVSDDGSGFEVRGAAAGAGLRNMEDRVASLGGTLEIESSTDDGTLVRGVIPVSQAVRNS